MGQNNRRGLIGFLVNLGGSTEMLDTLNIAELLNHNASQKFFSARQSRLQNMI